MILKHSSQLYLWTERCANRHCKILYIDKTWKQFDNLEKTYFKVKREKLTCIEDVLIENLRFKNNVALEVKIEVKTIKDVVILNSTYWKKETSLLTVKIARGQGDLSYIKYFTNES
ncbi:hypothetical protein ACDW39_12770|uniref:hypothetical protein n=1 Tax=Clostridioides difficile TaxID=1496 RepID=UPI003556F453